MGIAFIRTIIIYLIVIFALRVMGKRQLGELQPSELVVTIMVSNVATMSIEDIGLPLLGTIIPIFSLVGCEVIMSHLIIKSNLIQRIVSGSPRIVINEGKVDQKELKNLRWTIEDLLEQLRTKNIFSVEEVSLAVVETSGNISVCQKFSFRPLTPDTVGKKTGEDMPPILLISDGSVVKDALTYCGIDMKWIGKTLKNNNLVLENVFMMTCDRSLKYKITAKENPDL